MRGAATRFGRSVSIAFVLGAALLAGRVTSSSADAGKHIVTLYSVATAVQYINNADDEARGMTNNPFDYKSNKLRPKLSWKGVGPFAGDVTVYSFNLYSSPKLTKSTGTASYTCYFNYDKTALCDADFALADGADTLVAAGPIDFNATRFTLVVTGGTSKYLGARGQLSETAIARKNAQRLDFLLLG